MYSLTEMPQQFLEVGNYGGFTGASSNYYLLPNGQRFFSKGVIATSENASKVELEQLKPKAFKAKIKELKNIDFSKINHTEKGNMTHYVRLKTKKKDHTVSWANSETAPQQVVMFYNTLMKEMKTDLIEK